MVVPWAGLCGVRPRRARLGACAGAVCHVLPFMRVAGADGFPIRPGVCFAAGSEAFSSLGFGKLSELILGGLGGFGRGDGSVHHVRQVEVQVGVGDGL